MIKLLHLIITSSIKRGKWFWAGVQSVLGMNPQLFLKYRLWRECCMPDMLLSHRHRMKPPPLSNWCLLMYSKRCLCLEFVTFSFQFRCSDADIKYITVLLPSSSPSFLLYKWKVREDYRTWLTEIWVFILWECVYYLFICVCMRLDISIQFPVKLCVLLSFLCKSDYKCVGRFSDACTCCYVRGRGWKANRQLHWTWTGWIIVDGVWWGQTTVAIMAQHTATEENTS